VASLTSHPLGTHIFFPSTNHTTHSPLFLHTLIHLKKGVATYTHSSTSTTISPTYNNNSRKTEKVVMPVLISFATLKICVASLIIDTKATLFILLPHSLFGGTKISQSRLSSWCPFFTTISSLS